MRVARCFFCYFLSNAVKELFECSSLIFSTADLKNQGENVTGVGEESGRTIFKLAFEKFDWCDKPLDIDGFFLCFIEILNLLKFMEEKRGP